MKIDKSKKQIFLITLLAVILVIIIYFVLSSFLSSNSTEIIDNSLNLESIINSRKNEFDTSLFENEIFKSLVQTQKVATTTLQIGRDNPFLKIEF